MVRPGYSDPLVWFPFHFFSSIHVGGFSYSLSPSLTDQKEEEEEVEQCEGEGARSSSVFSPLIP